MRLFSASAKQELTAHRSGAVEQLRVHVRNLSMLGVNGPTDSKSRVELFERGYGKDAAAIAREAIAFGNTPGFCAYFELNRCSEGPGLRCCAY